jgi:hypothetical protein
MSALKNNTWDKHVAGLCARAAVAASKSIIVSFQNSTGITSEAALCNFRRHNLRARARLVHKSSLSFP